MTKQKIQKQKWKPGNMVYPLPAVMVSCGDETKSNIVTVAWTGTICTNPAMTYISLRPSRFSYNLIKETGYFVINLTTRRLVKATDYCGVRSGRDHDKFKEMGLTPIYDEETKCPMIAESPVSVVCKVTEIKTLGSHDMFIAMVMNVYIDETYLDEKGKFHLNDTELIAYSHGTYLTLGKELGTFGYSVRKTPVTHQSGEPLSNKKNSNVSRKAKKTAKAKNKKKKSK